MGGYIEPGLPVPRGDPPRTPPYVCVTITARHAADYSLRSFVMFLLLLQLVYSQITYTTFIRHIGGFKHILQSSSSLVVLCAHARGSAALVRVSAGAAGHDAC